MSGLYTVAAVICGSSVILAVLSHFVTDGGTKKLLRLVMGAFMLCCIAAPTLRAPRIALRLADVGERLVSALQIVARRHRANGARIAPHVRGTPDRKVRLEHFLPRLDEYDGHTQLRDFQSVAPRDARHDHARNARS